MRRSLYWWLGSVLVLLFLLFLSVWSGQAAHELLCTQIAVSIEDSLESRFLTPRRVESYLLRGVNDPRGTSLLEVNTQELESYLAQHPSVEGAEVSVDCGGILHVRVWQRKPFFRLMSALGGACYVDYKGLCFSLSKDYTAHVPIVSGNFPFPGHVKLIPSSVEGPSLLRADSVLHEERGDVEGAWGDFWVALFSFMQYIEADKFWRDQIAQVWVGSRNHVELIPRVGGHTILLGSLENYEYKLNKLWSLYRANLPEEGLNAYSHLDLRFGNQVVCKRWK